jgi:hypothetical protein
MEFRKNNSKGAQVVSSRIVTTGLLYHVSGDQVGVFCDMCQEPWPDAVSMDHGEDVGKAVDGVY